MKKFISIFLSLSTVLTSSATVALADSPSYSVGDIVWSEDFDSFDAGYDYGANSTNGITFTSKTAVGSAVISETGADGKYLYVSALNGGGSNGATYTMAVPAGEAAQGDDKIFTIDMDMKFDAFDAADKVGGKAAEYNLGLGINNSKASYGTISPDSDNNNYNSGFVINRSASWPEKIQSEGKARTEDEAALSKTGRLMANAWNNYRFIARKKVVTDEEATESVPAGEYYYADMYVNGMYFWLIGMRSGGSSPNWNTPQDCFVFEIFFNSGITAAGVAIDNIKCYYGAVESSDYVTKGSFTIDTYKFDECTPGVYAYTENEGGSEIVAGGEYDHAFGVIKRYNRWGMNLDIDSGKAGKEQGDNSLSVHNGGRINFTTALRNQALAYSATHSIRSGTWVPEGDSLEFSSDILFKTKNDNWLMNLNPTGSQMVVMIEVTPNFWSTGLETNNDYQNNRQRIAPKLPLNKWMNIRVIITRGAGDALNKLTIYADDTVICENVDIATWYNVSDGTIDKEQSLGGSILSKGFDRMYFTGYCDYDNISIKKHLLGATPEGVTTPPSVIAEATKIDEYPSIRGKIYTAGRSISDVLAAFDITDNYVVRDESGNVVTNYSQSADGKYAELTQNGKKYYVTFTGNNVLNTIDEANADLGGFTYDDTAVSAETATVGYGRNSSDKSILIKNINGESPATANALEGPRFVNAVNTDENAYMEFSFLANEDTDFYVGYSVYYVRNGNTEGYNTKLGAPRGYYDNIHFADNVVKSTNSDNGYKTVGTYNNNEWVKVRIEWNSMNNNSVAVSVNDGKTVLMNNGPSSYFKTIRDIAITPAANKSVYIDDLVIMEGYKPKTAAPAISAISDSTIYNIDDEVSLPAYATSEFAYVRSLSDSIAVSPLSSTKSWIKANGAVATANADTVDKLVLVSDGVYKYYPVTVREDGITVLDNGDGTSKVIVDVTNTEVSDLSNAKLISVVYNDDNEIEPVATVSIKDITFEEDTFTCETTVTPLDYDPSTQSVKYFAWVNKIVPLCKAK